MCQVRRLHQKQVRFQYDLKVSGFRLEYWVKIARVLKDETFVFLASCLGRITSRCYFSALVPCCNKSTDAVSKIKNQAISESETDHLSSPLT